MRSLPALPPLALGLLLALPAAAAVQARGPRGVRLRTPLSPPAYSRQELAAAAADLLGRPDPEALILAVRQGLLDDPAGARFAAAGLVGAAAALGGAPLGELAAAAPGHPGLERVRTPQARRLADRLGRELLDAGGDGLGRLFDGLLARENERDPARRTVTVAWARHDPAPTFAGGTTAELEARRRALVEDSWSGLKDRASWGEADDASVDAFMAALDAGDWSARVITPESLPALVRSAYLAGRLTEERAATAMLRWASLDEFPGELTSRPVPLIEDGRLTPAGRAIAGGRRSWKGSPRAGDEIGVTAEMEADLVRRLGALTPDQRVAWAVYQPEPSSKGGPKTDRQSAFAVFETQSLGLWPAGPLRRPGHREMVVLPVGAAQALADAERGGDALRLLPLFGDKSEQDVLGLYALDARLVRVPAPDEPVDDATYEHGLRMGWTAFWKHDESHWRLGSGVDRRLTRLTPHLANQVRRVLDRQDVDPVRLPGGGELPRLSVRLYENMVGLENMLRGPLHPGGLVATLRAEGRWAGLLPLLALDLKANPGKWRAAGLDPAREAAALPEDLRRLHSAAPAGGAL